jgi:pimeloyl-ACP methyl ester carboxylesterase
MPSTDTSGETAAASDLLVPDFGGGEQPPPAAPASSDGKGTLASHRLASASTFIELGATVARTTQDSGDLQEPGRLEATRRGRIGLIVAGSLAAGLVAALVLVAAPFIAAQENVLTGVVLLGFAFGWALLAVLSVRFTDQPQRWAAAPAAFMGVAGLALVSGSAAVQDLLSWVWPPVLFGLVVWMFLRVRRQLRSRSARWLLYPVLAVLMIVSVGTGYETVRESLDARAYPAPGQLIDVGGHRLHLHCTGSGSPTVVLEPGLGEASWGMAWIAPAVARDTRVCVYDRAGRGWSDAADGPRDAVQTATDLHTLLDRAHIPGPFVLAGHSFGGLYVLTFAATYPDQVAGLVLVDSTAPKPGAAAPTKAGSYDLVGRLAALLPAVAHIGVIRLVNQVSYGNLPPRARDEARARSATASDVASFLNESRAGGMVVHQAASLVDFADKPLIVITAGRGNDDAWRAAQDKLATLSTNSRHRIVADATHASLVDQTDAPAVSQAIRDVVAAVRTDQPLVSR